MKIRISAGIIAMTLLPASMATAQSLVFDPLAGGFIDEQAGLVWGYDYATVTGYPDAEASAPPVDYATAAALAATYPDLLARYGWEDEALVAGYWEAQGLRWRLPTLSEAWSAWNSGLFVQDGYWHVGGWAGEISYFRWTSSGKGASKRYVFDDRGSELLIGVNSEAAIPLFVRPLNPPPAKPPKKNPR